jgi:hypothetical protein
LKRARQNADSPCSRINFEAALTSARVRLTLEGERESATRPGFCIRAGFFFETLGEENEPAAS